MITVLIFKAKRKHREHCWITGYCSPCDDKGPYVLSFGFDSALVVAGWEIGSRINWIPVIEFLDTILR